jgi:CubicO group peptidase (beta-lactamase class C family)
MKFNIAFTFLFLCLVIALNAQNAALQKVDQYLQEYKEKIPIPGFSIVLVEKDKIIFNKGYGVERQGIKHPISPNSSLGIGSIGRGFTAIAVLQLVEKGLLDLDAPITQYLPWFKTANKNLSDEITLRHCLSNTSGIPPFFESVPHLDPNKSLEHFVRSMESQYLQRKPGLSHEFSDEGYSIAGLIISEVSGMSYPAYLQKHVFEPLEMNRSTTDPSLFDKMGVLYGHEMLLDECVEAKKGNIEGNYLPAGSEMRSSTKDLGKYLIALMNQGNFKGKSILSPKSIETLFKSNISFQGLGTMLGGNGIDIQYALGWMGMEIENRKIFIHTGNTGTSAAIIGINPAKDQGVAILFNGDVNQLDRFVYPNLENTANNVIHLMNNEPTTDFAVVRFSDPFDDYYDLEKEEWKKYMGTYHSFGRTSPFFKNRRLEVFVGESDSLELKVWKESALKGHYHLQFSSRSRAVLRNISQPREIQFKIYPNGTIGGLFLSGTEFKKKDPSLKERFLLQKNEEKQVSFLFPKGASVNWTAQGVLATFDKKEATDLKMQFNPLNKTFDFEAYVNQHFEGKEVTYRGLVKKIAIKEGIWTEQNIFTKEQNKLQQHLLVVYQNPLSNRQLELQLSNPWGQFDSSLQEILMHLQQSISF